MIPKSDNTPPTIPPPIEPAKVLKKEEKNPSNTTWAIKERILQDSLQWFYSVPKNSIRLLHDIGKTQAQFLLPSHDKISSPSSRNLRLVRLKCLHMSHVAIAIKSILFLALWSATAARTGKTRTVALEQPPNLYDQMWLRSGLVSITL